MIYGGKRFGDKGNYFMPTVIECDKENIIVKEEIFGPVFSLIKGKDDNELIEIANETKYGLGAVIMTEEEDRIKYVS